MVSKNTIAFLILLPLMFEVAPSLAQPSDSPDRGVAPDFSYSRGNLEVSAPKPSALGRRTLRGGASLAVNKNQAPSPADACNLQPHALGPCHAGSGVTESPTESPKGMSASSTHSLHTDSFCPDCESGSIDPNTPIQTPP
ncbi:uncharacterized protein [Elaeis guineensis]|uniref:Uncharacterized protein LOC105042318 n=1 Tax=Elaeis guineensis var. tenera TaxID=51953 RepID=A0A6I9QZ66_ELAGV|nr:uncharacterized protein LOC105042318 [Elaeis guineensis]